MLRASARIALDRRTIGLSVLLAAIIISAVMEATFLHGPLDDGKHVLPVAILVLAAGSAGAALVLTWRARSQGWAARLPSA